MVWAAVKRNSCQKMTHEERRECPLLRCRKRFPNHELMLQHLFVCEELAAGEYWCYDCTRVERFTDAKCKRCLGHPSKRRKIMFMARNFFSSLGHRSKASSLPDLDMDVDEAPPSYNEALDVPPAPLPQQAELQANEIHEIDSNEVPLSTIIEDAEEDPISLPLQMPQPVPPVPPVSTLTLSRPKIHPAELESANWQLPAQPETVAPANLNLFNDDQQARSPDRPTLQVRTTDLAQYRAQAKRRSKMLAPSSSVRSTASTNSTNSTNSTASSGSYAISPMSSWSGGWARVNGFDSTLTSPADDFAPSNPFASSYKPECEFPSTNPFQSQDNQPAVGDQLNVNLEQTFSTELPADMPMVDVIPPSDPMGPSLDPFQPSFPFDAATASDLSLGTALSLNQDSQSQALPSKLESDSTGSHHGSAHSLVSTAWDALQMHVAESMERLRDIQDNHLVDQLRAMSPELVASTGLKALDSILNRTIVESPVDLLCFVHLVYSFSLVIHEQDAPTRGTKLFSQAMSYASWLTKLDRHPYFVIVDALWKPSGMDKSEVVGLMRKSSSAAATRLKGKQPQQLAPEPSTDSLAFVAQFFLDGKSDEKRRIKVPANHRRT